MFKLIEKHDDYLVVEIATRISKGTVENRRYIIDADFDSQRAVSSIKLLHDLAEVSRDPSKRGSGTIFADSIRASDGQVPVGKLLHKLTGRAKRTPGALHNDLRRSAWL